MQGLRVKQRIKLTVKGHVYLTMFSDIYEVKVKPSFHAAKCVLLWMQSGNACKLNSATVKMSQTEGIKLPPSSLLVPKTKTNKSIESNGTSCLDLFCFIFLIYVFN